MNKCMVFNKFNKSIHWSYDSFISQSIPMTWEKLLVALGDNWKPLMWVNSFLFIISLTMLDIIIKWLLLHLITWQKNTHTCSVMMRKWLGQANCETNQWEITEHSRHWKGCVDIHWHDITKNMATMCNPVSLNAAFLDLRL